jgi:hypothetical protein
VGRNHIRTDKSDVTLGHEWAGAGSIAP